jgi:hypothetical protein
LRADTKAPEQHLKFNLQRRNAHTEPHQFGAIRMSRDGLLIEERGEIIDAAVWTHRNLAISVVQSDSVKRSVMSVASLSQKSLPR